MKRKLLILLTLFVLGKTGMAQKINFNTGIVSVDTIGTKFPVVVPPPVPVIGASAKQNTSKRTIFWFEPGDGFFTNNPITAHQISTRQNYFPLMLATNLYDTSRYPPPTIFRFNSSQKLSSLADSKAAFTNMLNTRGVKITPSVWDIVPGDTMIFALTYKTYKDTAKQNIDPKATPVVKDQNYKLYFFYNNNRSFFPITREVPIGNSSISNIRYHFGEVPGFNTVTSLDKNYYKNSVCYNIPNNMDMEKTVFLSLVPDTTIEEGKTGSVYAVLTDASNNVIGTDSIANMRFAPAHDPNYLSQRPFCLKLPKKEYPFVYKVHFQNTGDGNATEVKLDIHLPTGLNWSTLNITKATFAGVDYTAVIKNNVSLNRTTGIATVHFFDTAILGRKIKLLGLAECDTNHPGNDPRSMGEILFDIKSTPNTDDKMEAWADIYFKSEHPSGDTVQGGYEQPVITNHAVTTYKDCCGCTTPTPLPPHCFTILGLCWWWWVLILIAVIFIWWLIARKKKDNKEAGTNNQC